MRKLIVLTMFAAVLALGGTVANAHERHQHNMPAVAAVSADTQADDSAAQAEAKEAFFTVAEHRQPDACAICGGTCCACGAGCVGAALPVSAGISFPPFVRASVAPDVIASHQPQLTADISGPPKTFA